MVKLLLLIFNCIPVIIKFPPRTPKLLEGTQFLLHTIWSISGYTHPLAWHFHSLMASAKLLFLLILVFNSTSHISPVLQFISPHNSRVFAPTWQLWFWARFGKWENTELHSWNFVWSCTDHYFVILVLLLYFPAQLVASHVVLHQCFTIVSVD